MGWQSKIHWSNVVIMPLPGDQFRSTRCWVISI